jgi:UDP-2,3-diacylglucosamine pyrophosphatase LpxH
MSLKYRIITAIHESGRDINEEDIPALEEEYISFVDWFTENSEKGHSFQLSSKGKKKSEGIFSWLEKENPEDQSALNRIVLVGDIHCDLKSLSQILYKLTLSEYDYFGNAYFIFLGDYIDRGLLPLHTLRLLFKIKLILGERCIFLKGNHDDIQYDEKENKFYSDVRPAETIELFNNYFKKDTLKAIKFFFDSLPYFGIIERNDKKYLVSHGGIPKDRYFDAFGMTLMDNIENISGVSENELEMKQFFSSMLWGDPADVKYKYQNNESRFEYGLEQFNSFRSKFNFSNIIRGHSTVKNGFELMFDERLATIFSTGGNNNSNSYYNDSVPGPAFGIIREDGTLIPESVHVSKIIINDESLWEKEAFNYFEADNANPESFILQGKERNSVLYENYDGCYGKAFLNDEFSIKYDDLFIPRFLADKWKPLEEHIESLFVKNKITTKKDV